MKIREVRTYSKDLGTSRPYSIAYKTVDEVINAFVEIELENGMVGIGAANPSPKVVGQSVEETVTQLQEIDFGYLEGRSIGEFEAMVRETQTRFSTKPGTNVAIDIALHDVFGQFLGVPLCQFFGRAHASMPTSITIGIKNVQETLEEAEEYRQMGFRILKVKTGLNPEEDAERVIRIQEQFPEFIIRVDANQGYTSSDLVRFLDLSKSVNLELIEQPFPIERFSKDIQSLAADTVCKVVADESLRQPDDALELYREAPQCRIFNIKLMKTGGLRAAQEIAQIAQYAGVDLMWGCNDESAVSIAAALHLSLSYAHTRYIDLDGSLDVIRDVASGGFEIREGVMYPGDQPGLGLTRI